MGSIKPGMAGLFNGKVGDIVISSWKGVPYVKSAPKKRKTLPTEKENINRQKWSIAHYWLQPITQFVRQGFKGYSERSEGFVAAKSYLLKNAIEGEAPDFTINPALVKVSAGTLPLPGNIAVEQINTYTLQFTWDSESDRKNKYDQAMLLAYRLHESNDQLNAVNYRLMGQLRSTGTDSLQLRSDLKGTFHLYIAFVSADRSAQSDSVYLGTVEI